MIKGKTIVLGITGSIAAYKAAELASELTKSGAKVETIMTEEALKFITPLTLRSLTGRQVVTQMFDVTSEYNVEHVALAEAADVVVIAPATANIIAKIASGIADDMLTCTVLATEAPIIISPAMNVNMYQNSITQENIVKLKSRGMRFVGPDTGRLATGKIGAGRFIDIKEIVAAIEEILTKKSDLVGKKVVVTAGGTQEPIDPVRCITNYSSGKMGFAIAEAARDRGARVTLVAAPVSIPDPYGIDMVHVTTAEDMLKAARKSVTGADILIMAAAVADYRPKRAADQKIKRQDKTELTIELERTPDILNSIKKEGLFRVGFAAESENLEANAKGKLQKKQLDMIVANDITISGCGFGANNNQVIIIDKKGNIERLPVMSKREVADKILDSVLKAVK